MYVYGQFLAHDCLQIPIPFLLIGREFHAAFKVFNVIRVLYHIDLG